jgi:IclR family KDG regulon transcriptional repressor
VRLGSRYGLLAVTTGQAVLAYLDQDAVDVAITEQRAAGSTVDPDEVATRLAAVRSNGYASGLGAHWTDLWGCAAPVFGAAGTPIGALGMSIPAARMDGAKDRVVAAVVREAAAMSRQLGQPTPDRAFA